MTPTAHPIEYIVTPFPLTSEASQIWKVTLSWRDEGKWAVMHGRQALSRSEMTFDYEPSPSERTDEWIDDHRWTFEEAVEKAQEAVMVMVVNGKTAEDAAALLEAAEAGEGET